MKGDVLRSVALAVLLVSAGCGRQGGPAEFDAAGGLAKVRAARARLDAARATLRDREAASPAGSASRAGDEAELATARAAFDRAYADYQRELAGFLTAAIERAPAADQTREALTLYGREAVASAEALARQDGDRRRALALLRTATGYFAAAGAPPPSELRAALGRLSGASPAVSPHH